MREWAYMHPSGQFSMMIQLQGHLKDRWLPLFCQNFFWLDVQLLAMIFNKFISAFLAPSRPLVAQLMRLHLVTPKAPIHVTLFPSVVPCPDGPVFHPGWTQPVKVPINSYWVLRFPYIYQGKRSFINRQSSVKLKLVIFMIRCSTSSQDIKTFYCI